MLRFLLLAYSIVLLAPLAPCSAQSATDSVTVGTISYSGNKKTRPSVIRRELTFKEGQRIAIADLPLLVSRAEEQILNTSLFMSAEIKYLDWIAPDYEVFFEIRVVEQWYIFPTPTFELADRNFNVWWTDQNRDIDRVNIGLKFSHYNFTGFGDKLKVGFEYGYTRSYQAGYSLPYINKDQSIGLGFSWSTNRNREVNYQTINDDQAFYNDEDDFVWRRTRVAAEASYRRKIFTTHTSVLAYEVGSINDTVAQLNPNFYGRGRNRQKFFRYTYILNYDRRDVRAYPWRGEQLRFIVDKAGLGLLSDYGRNGLWTKLEYNRYWPLGPEQQWSLFAGASGKYSLIRKRQPFLDNRAIGFGREGSMVGYQFYVIDGLDMLILRAGLRRELFRTQVVLGNWVPLKNFRTIPIRVNLSLQTDQGIANSPFTRIDNRLANRWLSGAGLGLDVIFFYDMVASVQYHRNHLGEGGVFVGLNLSF